jgi:hypothetical protein
MVERPPLSGRLKPVMITVAAVENTEHVIAQALSFRRLVIQKPSAKLKRMAFAFPALLRFMHQTNHVLSHRHDAGASYRSR